ncbi:MAG TPA: GNAT family N-acetyltransferase [Chloroflexota bacterium]|nr:GNAT family N-acetyltransferase [Chloroflexota bacterium]
MKVQIRPFQDDDRYAIAEIHNHILPDEPMDVEQMHHADATWDATRYTLVRLVAQSPAGAVVGWGQISHWTWFFHPQRFGLRLEVDPAFHGQGIGSALYAHLLDELRACDAVLVRTDTPEFLISSIRFLKNRGFHEVDRTWDSHLDISRFDFGPFVGAEERVAREGITITTLAAEHASDPTTQGKVYELFTVAEQDEPSLDPMTPLPLSEFVTREIEDPVVIPEAFFLACDGKRFIGMSSLQRLPPMTDVVDSGFTGVHPDYRGRGVALALKLRSIHYASEHGYREIRTSNSARNEPMLRINVGLGFVRRPAGITFEKTLADRERCG